MSDEKEDKPQKADSRQDAEVEDSGNDDLDSLLDEYEQKPKGVGKKKADDDTDELKEFARAAKQEKEQREFAENMDNSIKRLKKAPGLERLHNDVLEALLYGAAAKNQSITLAFGKQRQHPRKWNDVLDRLGKQFSKLFEEPDEKATEDREAVMASVRTSTKAPTDKKPDDPTEGMSPEQFRAYFRRKNWI